MEPRDLPRIAYDPAAFEAFYRANVGRVEGFVARRVSDPYHAADLTADVFLAAIDAAGGYRPERGMPSAWLFGIARNVVADHHRQTRREHEANARISGRRLLDADDVERLQERIDAAARARQLLAAVAALPEDQQAVLELVALDELSLNEVAAVLGIRPVTARVRLHRARTALRTTSFDDASSVTTHPLEAS